MLGGRLKYLVLARNLYTAVYSIYICYICTYILQREDTPYSINRVLPTRGTKLTWLTLLEATTHDAH